MFNPITLTKYGDALLTPPARGGYLDDEEVLPELPGDHSGCGGNFAIFKISEGWRRMTCRRCNLVVEFTSQVKTYGDLRKYFTDKLKPLNN